MNIIISAHFDLARPVMSIKLDKDKLSGLVDNFAGVFVAYQTSRQTGVPVYFTNYEELEYDGAMDVASRLDPKETLVIVVDTIKESDISGRPVAIINAYNIDTAELRQKFQDEIDFIDGYFEETEDETFVYGKTKGFRTFFFGIPVPKEYHSTDNSILLKNIDKATELLVKIVESLKS